MDVEKLHRVTEGEPMSKWEVARAVFAALLPLPACVLQWLLWPYISPFVWFFFFPTVFFSSRIGGKVGGLAATFLSAVLVVYVFLPPELSFQVANPFHLYFVPVFILMGVLFSLTHDRLRKTSLSAGAALVEARNANERLREAHSEVTALYRKEREFGKELASLLHREREGGRRYDAAEGSASNVPAGNRELLAEVARLLEERRLREVELANSRLAAMNLMEDAILARNKAETLALQHKRGEEEREQTVELLRILSKAERLAPLMEELTAFFKRLSGMEGVGVRLSDGRGYPFFDAQTGFPDQLSLPSHVASASFSSSSFRADDTPALDCLCGVVIGGSLAVSQACYTDHGTFWTGSTSTLFRSASGSEFPRSCEHCVTLGCESLALFPLRYQEECYGFFQFGDRRTGCLTEGRVRQLEELVAYVAVALAKLQSDHALKESSRLYHQIISSAGEGIIVYGNDLKYQVWNPYMETMTGVPAQEVLGRHPLELFPFLEEKGVVRRVEQALRGEAPGTLEYCYFDPRFGRTRWFYQTCVPLRNVRNEIVGVLGMARDVTQEKMLEEQLRHAQKMEAIGQLAGGVAHDFNNILMVIYGYCNLVRMQMTESSLFRHEIDQVLAAAERAANLTKSLLAFSRKQVMQPKPVDLNALVVQVAGFLTRIIGEDIALRQELHAGNVMVHADSGQLEQVLMNLAANARDAMPDGGTLTVRTGIKVIGEDFLHAHGYGAPGCYAVLSVHDTGPGMDPEIREKIFDPFFTTKGVGKGTGLGLSIVYGVVKQHSGYITVVSEAGDGTGFQIYLPLLSAQTEAEAPVAPVWEEQSGHETILVAEDDPAIREFLVKVLGKYGYRVVAAHNGQEAVDLFKSEREPIDLVLMDMIMPVKGGKEAGEEIKRLNEKVALLFMTGYSPDLLHSRGLMARRGDILMKPVQPLELLRKVREVLDVAAQGEHGGQV